MHHIPKSTIKVPHYLHTSPRTHTTTTTCVLACTPATKTTSALTHCFLHPPPPPTVFPHQQPLFSIRLDTLEDFVIEEKRTQKPNSTKRQVQSPPHQRHVDEVDEGTQHTADVTQCVEQETNGVEEHVECNTATTVE